MAGLTSQGLGSGLDIASLVAKLVAAEKAPRQTQITRAQTSTVTTISALASLKGSMSSFNDSLASIKTVDVFAARAASSSAPGNFSVSAGTTAVSGSYDVQIERLASAHQISSGAHAGGAGQVVGTGTLTIAVGTESFSVGVDSSHNTLAQIRDAINQSADNGGKVSATIVNANDGAHLVLSAQATGEANAITVSQEGGDGGLAGLEYNSLLTTNYTQLRPAQDAQVFIAGYEHLSNTNTFIDAIDGVTITALDADPGETHSLTISDDTAGTTARIRKFVDEYNALEKQIASLRSYEPSTRRAGPLLGDAMLRGIETDLRARLGNVVEGLEGNYQTLASVGITTQRDGTLTLDTTKLQAALTADFDGVAQLFGSENGVAARLSASVTPQLDNDAQIATRTEALNKRSVALQKQQADLEVRMAAVERRYNAQFNALDSLLSNLQSQSTFLAQQLTSIANIGSSSK